MYLDHYRRAREKKTEIDHLKHLNVRLLLSDQSMPNRKDSSAKRFAPNRHTLKQ